MKFLIGYEIGSGTPVEAELHHLLISGVTQHSGKTTSLEAFIDRVQPRRSLVFRCGRGEIGFDKAHRIRPFFRERADWRYVEGFLSAHLQEKTKFFRAEIMKATRGAHSLDDVQAYVKRGLGKARKDSWMERIFTELDQYFTEVLPIVRGLNLSSKLEITDGMNLIDLEGVPLAVQQLIISSCADTIMESMRDVILVIPEAWQMVPEDRMSPVKLSVENITRQGAKIGNYVWLDSQQMTGVDMQILRNVDIWLFGRQSLDLEKKRVAKMIPKKKLVMDDIHALTVGEFYVVLYGEDVRKVYVRPTWIPDDIAIKIAKGERSVRGVSLEFKPKEEPRDMDEEERKEYDRQISELKHTIGTYQKTVEVQSESRKSLEKQVADLKAQVTTLKGHVDSADEETERIKDSVREASKARLESMAGIPAIVEGDIDLETLAKKVADMLGIKAEDLLLTREEPTLTVKVDRPVVKTDETTLRGKLVVLVAEDFFSQAREPKEVIDEFGSRGYGDWTGGTQRARMSEQLGWLCSTGFLRRQEGRYVANPGIKKRIEVTE